MIPTIAPYFLPTVIASITHMHPELDIHVREALTSTLIEELTEGRLDAAIVALPVSEPSLTEVRLFAEKFLLVRPAEDEGTPVPSGKKLRSMRLLNASSLSTLVQMVGAGMGVTLIPEMAAAVETRSASVCLARFRDPQPSRTIGMIWRTTSPLACQLLQLTEVVRGAADASYLKRDRGRDRSPS
jgi:LysR family hydrogen peroxide-inducible transcriptional activator